MAYSVIKKDGKIKDFIQNVRHRRNVRKTEALTGVKEEKPFKGHSEKEMRDPNAPKPRKNKSGCGKGGLFNTRFGGCFDGGKSAYR